MGHLTAHAGYLRSLRSHVGDEAVLNGGEEGREPCTDLEALSVELVRAARNTDFNDAAQRTAYEARARLLATAVPTALGTPSQQRATWLNLYNALVLHALAAFEVRESVLEVRGFFNRAAYRVGRWRFSLLELEHGLLRANARPHPRVGPPFLPGDARLVLACDAIDARVHFALNCGAASCPPIAAYRAETLDQGLETAARSFVNGNGCVVRDGTAQLSAIFEAYANDFGGRDAVRGWVLRYLEDENARRLIEEGRYVFGAYDWTVTALVAG